MAAVGDPSAAIIIASAGSGVDVKRASGGEVAWSRAASPGWLVLCAPLPEWPAELDRVEVDGVPVVLPEIRGNSRSFRVSIRRGKLHAAIAAYPAFKRTRWEASSFPMGCR